MTGGRTGLVLASGSASRLALLRAAGLLVHVHRPDVDEGAVKRASRADGPQAAALRLAELKARTAHAPGDLVIGADQILVCGDRWFDKPADLHEARDHLRRLRGRTHELVTACVLLRDGAIVWQHVARPSLTMRSFGDAFLDACLHAEGDALLSTVGAYRLEGPGLQLFDRVDGEHGAILGLPMLPLLAALRDLGAIAA